MRSEVENILDELRLLYPGSGYESHRADIKAYIQRAEIRYQYHEQRAIRSYGNYRQIKEELAAEYGCSVSTIEDIIKPVKLHEISV